MTDLAQTIKLNSSVIFHLFLGFLKNFAKNIRGVIFLNFVRDQGRWKKFRSRRFLALSDTLLISPDQIARGERPISWVNAISNNHYFTFDTI